MIVEISMELSKIKRKERDGMRSAFLSTLKYRRRDASKRWQQLFAVDIDTQSMPQKGVSRKPKRRRRLSFLNEKTTGGHALTL
ncbi:hypothetical protein QJS04_geneDACA019794 [Acorus gramineus]|uniref:Uncharacterized protein n=1 Tax=Acorus gramineus TaxID=55184 RepID=A0AAV8ZWZ9_ACOGR|nr:hypothetical protein QJS04_geneDACA019794 [Acorus gramineus]